MVGDSERFPACWETQGIVDLNKALQAKDGELFNQLLAQNECYWLNDGDTVKLIGSDRPLNAVVGDGTVIPMLFITPEDTYREAWFPAGMLVKIE